MLNSRKGFTLVEMIVVMAVFVVVIMITADSFKTILTQMTKITKSEESNIEGVVGLEMFRMIFNSRLWFAVFVLSPISALKPVMHLPATIMIVPDQQQAVCRAQWWLGTNWGRLPGLP